MGVVIGSIVEALVELVAGVGTVGEFVLGVVDAVVTDVIG